MNLITALTLLLFLGCSKSADIDKYIEEVFGEGFLSLTEQPITTTPDTTTTTTTSSTTTTTTTPKATTTTKNTATTTTTTARSEIEENVTLALNVGESEKFEEDYVFEDTNTSVTTENDELCTCVPYYMCTSKGVNVYGEWLIDKRGPDNFMTTTPAATQLTFDKPCPSSIQVCCKFPEEDNEEPTTHKKSSCGRRNPKGIDGGKFVPDSAKFGEFPWMVAVMQIVTAGGYRRMLPYYQCGGALIHPAVVLTAAHCVHGVDHLSIRAGEWDLEASDEVLEHQERKVIKIVEHPKFNNHDLRNDIALLFLNDPVEITNHVDVVCLPKHGLNFDGSRCIATGWGKDVVQMNNHAILREVELPVIDRKTCELQLRLTRLSEVFKLHKSFMCAAVEDGKDTCRGDGGSPLVCPIDGLGDQYVQAGIVSWGIGCGESGVPGVYTDVARFRDWIDEEMALNNLNSSTYHYNEVRKPVIIGDDMIK